MSFREYITALFQARKRRRPPDVRASSWQWGWNSWPRDRGEVQIFIARFTGLEHHGMCHGIKINLN